MSSLEDRYREIDKKKAQKEQEDLNAKKESDKRQLDQYGVIYREVITRVLEIIEDKQPPDIHCWLNYPDFNSEEILVFPLIRDYYDGQELTRLYLRTNGDIIHIKSHGSCGFGTICFQSNKHDPDLTFIKFVIRQLFNFADKYLGVSIRGEWEVDLKY